MNTTLQTKQPQKNKGFQVWYQLMRPHTLTAGFTPVFIGSIYAFHVDSNSFNWSIFITILLATILIQTAANVFNEYFDYKRGLDNESSVGISGTIVRDGISPKTVYRLGISFMLVAILLGIYICMNSSWYVALIGLICMAAAYFYTGGPYPIAYTPFGELTSGFFMGVVLLNISYFVQAGNVTIESILLSIPLAFTIAAILLSNNIRDLDNDKVNGRRTIAILLGHDHAIKFLASLLGGAYVITLLLIIMDIAPLWALISFLSVPLSIKAVKGFIGKNTPIEMMPAMVQTAKVNTIFGLLLCIAFVLQIVFS